MEKKKHALVRVFLKSEGNLQTCLHQVMSSLSDPALVGTADKNPSVTETMSSMRECIITTRLEAVRARLLEAEREKIAESTFEKLAPARMARVQLVVKHYLSELRLGLPPRVCHEKTDIVLRAIFDAHIETLVPDPRDPYVIDPKFPSLAVLKLLSMRFPNDHMGDGYHTLEIMRVQHYELFLDAVVKKLVKLRGWIASVKARAGTARGLEGSVGPGEWRTVQEVAIEALEAGRRPLHTTMVISELAWSDGWDPAMRMHGNPPAIKAKYRAHVMGYHIQYCLIKAQGTCPLCLHHLLSDLDLANIHTAIAAMHTIHFDHFLPSLKGESITTCEYRVISYWYNQPLVLDLNKEKCSGCFVHQRCHHLRG